MHYTIFIAKRYVFSKGDNHAINIITKIASLGVIIGGMALYVVLAGFAGLKDFSLSFSSHFDPDLKVTAKKGKILTLSNSTLDRIRSISGIKTASTTLEERIFLKYQDQQTIAYIKGIDSTYQDIVDGKYITQYGNWLNGNPYQIVSGIGIANALQFSIASLYTNTMYLYVPRAGKSIPSDLSKAFRKKQVTNIGIYNINEDQNNKYVFAYIELAKELLGYSQDQYSTLELKLNGKGENENDIRKELNSIIHQEINIENKIQLNASLYKMLNTEHLISYLVITLIAIIALFNVTGAIIMVIINKQKQIKTLKYLGATPKHIRSIFFLQGTLMTTIGTFIGVILGVLVVWAHQKYEFVYIGAIPYPSKIQISDIVLVCTTIITIGIVATVFATKNLNKQYFQIT